MHSSSGKPHAYKAGIIGITCILHSMSILPSKGKTGDSSLKLFTNTNHFNSLIIWKLENHILCYNSLCSYVWCVHVCVGVLACACVCPHALGSEWVFVRVQVVITGNLGVIRQELCILCVCFWSSVSLCGPCWPGICYVHQVGIEVTELCLPLEFCD